MNWKIIIKLLITAVIIGVIIRTADMPELLAAFRSVPITIVVSLVVLYFICQSISTIKWRIFVRAGGIDVSIADTFKAYFIGMFVNCFGLGMVGGDVVRGVMVVPAGASRSVGITSAFVDRVHGLAVLATIGALSAVIFRPKFLDYDLIILLAAICGVSLAGWIFAPWFIRQFFKGETTFSKKLNECSALLSRDPKVLLYSTLLSFLFHVLQISLHAFIAYGLSVDIPFYYLLATVPFINILSSLPVSWNGVGVREAGYIFFFVQAHAYMTQEQAIVMGALWLLAVTVSSGIGGIFAFLSKDFSFQMGRAFNGGKVKILEQGQE